MGEFAIVGFEVAVEVELLVLLEILSFAVEALFGLDLSNIGLSTRKPTGIIAPAAAKTKAKSRKMIIVPLLVLDFFGCDLAPRFSDVESACGRGPLFSYASSIKSTVES